jgi:uncharacterized ferredoxin-like protein
MTGERLDYDTIRLDAVTQVAKLMAAAAITAPKSGGQLFLAGKANFLETVIITEPATRTELAQWMRARGKERREQIWFRDAEVAEAVDAILFVGLAPNWYPPNYDCGACGYATCAEFLHQTRNLRDESTELEFTGPTCNLRDIDLGIAVGSAAKPPHCTRSTVAAKPAPPSPPANSASSPPRSPSRYHCPSPTRPSASTDGCQKPTSTPGTSPAPTPSQSESKAAPATAVHATANNPAAR